MNQERIDCGDDSYLTTYLGVGDRLILHNEARTVYTIKRFYYATHSHSGALGFYVELESKEEGVRPHLIQDLNELLSSRNMYPEKNRAIHEKLWEIKEQEKRDYLKIDNELNP